MKYLNLELANLRGPEYLGSDPVDRATWLCLLAYSADQENSGRLAGAAGWKDRRWQQLVGVTEEEVRRPSELWTWTADDLVVNFYPLFQEHQVQVARINGAKGGRPPVENLELTQDQTQAEPNPKPSTKPRPKRKGNGKGKGKGKGNSSPPLTPPKPTATTTPQEPTSTTTTDDENILSFFPDIHPEDVDAYGPAPANSPTPEHSRWPDFVRNAKPGERFDAWLAETAPKKPEEVANV